MIRKLLFFFTFMGFIGLSFSQNTGGIISITENAYEG